MSILLSPSVDYIFYRALRSIRVEQSITKEILAETSRLHNSLKEGGGKLAIAFDRKELAEKMRLIINNVI